MSRASDLRDDIVEQLKLRLSIDDDRIDAFLVPDFDREELIEPRVGVRIGEREFQIDQGPEHRDVFIEIGVLGLTNEADESLPATKESFRQQQVDSADVLDALMEEIIGLWTPHGVLSRPGLADHKFMAITQPAAFDPKQLYDNGVWVAIIRLQYRDTKDI